MEYFLKSGIKIGKRQASKKHAGDKIIELLSEKIMTNEELAREMNISISEINQKLLIYEMEGLIEESEGKYRKT